MSGILQTGPPQSSMSIYGPSHLRRSMVGAWFAGSPGIGGRMHNHAPHPSSLTQSAAIVHAIVTNPYALATAWHLSQGWVGLETSDNSASGTFVELGDPIATLDDFTILIGWIPVSTAIPTGTGPGTMFLRGQDGSGNGWNIFLRHDGTNQVSCAVVTTSAGTVQSTATGANAGLVPGQPNFAAGSFRQGSAIKVACNGRFLASTAVGANSLRTSGVGCRLGWQTSASASSHCDPILFCILWRCAMSEQEMQLITGQPWMFWAPGPSQFDVPLGAFTISRDVFMPVDALGLIDVQRDAFMPVDSLGNVSRGIYVPVDSIGWAQRFAFIPVDSQGHDPFALAHDWNVRTKFQGDLFHSFDVIQQLFESSMEHDFNVIGQGFGSELPHSWLVIPNVPHAFGVNPDGTPIVGTDIQCPVATVAVS